MKDSHPSVRHGIYVLAAAVAVATLSTAETHPTRTEIRRVYDELGNLRQYIDERGEVTHYDTDNVGRTFRIRYPDGTREEIRFEEGTGAQLAIRDRAGQWFWFEYDPSSQRVVAEHLGGTGDEPSLTANPFTRYSYDDAARLTRITQADAAIEYSDFDLLGRPRLTKLIRFTTAPCPPSTLPCGTGLTSGEVAEVYTQGHQWSVFADERERWRMPAAGDEVAEAEPPSSWRKWIVETRDGAGNLVTQQNTLSATSSPDGPPISESVARGVGRLAERRTGPLTSRFGYADRSSEVAAPVVPSGPAAPGAPIGSLGRAETLRGGLLLAGSEITLDVKQRIGESTDLGLLTRDSRWSYDGRARLESGTLLQKADSITALPRVEETVLPSDFRRAREISPERLGTADYEALGVLAKSVTPLSWTAAVPAAGNQLVQRSFTHGALPEGEESFTYAGGRRTEQGTSRFTYDPRGRLRMHEVLAEGRSIIYDYDPNDRIVGRTVYRLTSAGTWVLEDRTNVLARDGLPAASTFVWDPIVDRLVAIFQSRTPQTSPEAGLLRQYVHGDQGYDDPVEVLVASAPGTLPRKYLPIVDHAGTGSVHAVADVEGNLVERVLYADSYGDAPRYLHGAVVERISVTEQAGGRRIRIDVSEVADPGTIAEGVRLTALGPAGETLRTFSFSAAPGDNVTSIEWTLSAAQWLELTDGASSVEIAILDTLRFSAWGNVPLQSVAGWETTLGRASFAAGAPFIKRITTADSGDVYSVPDLYLIARTESKSKLLTDFHALPFRDPASGLTYARARWLDNTTGQFVTPDPMGYEDSSSLYQYAGNDPVNLRDPSGEFVNHAIGGAVSVGLGWGIATLMKQDYTWTDAAIDFSLGAATSGLSSIDKIAKLGKLGRLGLRATAEVSLDVSLEVARYEIKGQDYELRDIGLGAMRNFAIGEAGALVGRKLGSKKPWPKQNPRHVSQSTDVSELDALLIRLGERAVRHGDRLRASGISGIEAGNYAETIYGSYADALNKRLVRHKSPYVVEWQPAMLPGYGRVPGFVEYQGGRAYPFPGSLRLDVGLSDKRHLVSTPVVSRDLYPTIIRGYDITIDRAKASAVSKYQMQFGVPVRDIRPR